MYVSRKILVPTLSSVFLHREQLFQKLGKALGASAAIDAPTPYHLVLLCAPAGYGKTALLADTVKRLSLTCCWYFLDRSDQDRQIFLKMLLASIRQHFPTFGFQLDTLLGENVKQDERACQTFLDMLIDTLATDIPGHLVLALCNYQEVNGSMFINDLVNYLLKRLPPQCLLVIESRALPDIELAVLVASQKMFGLGSKDLRFSAQDVYALAQLQGLQTFSEERAAQIVITFDGWITGMLLGSSLGPTQFNQFTSPSSSNPATKVPFNDRRQLLAFIVTEVFRNETVIYTFLKETALLDWLLPTFCDAFLKTSNAAILLEYAERQGLFVTCIAIEGGELVYQCHFLLRQLLQEELCHREGEKYRTLHKQIATLFYQQQAYQSALNHALEAQEYNLMTQILLEVTPTLFDQGQSELVLRCLDCLPLDVIQKNPRLLLIRVNTYLRRGDFANAHRCFEQAGDQIADLESREYTIAHAELALAQGKLFLHQGKHQQAQEQFQSALEWLPLDERVLRVRAYQQLGICIILSGQHVHQGIAQFQHALSLCHPRLDERLAGELHHQLANAYGWAGNYTIAEHHRQRIRALQESSDQPQHLINNLIGMGLLKMRLGSGEEAETFFQHTLRLARQSPRFLSSEAYALLGLGELEWTRQHFKDALMRLEEALFLGRQLGDRYLLNGILNMLALVYLRMGDSYTAQCLQEQTSLQANETRSYESVLSTLVQGTIRLAQQRYDEAKMLLSEAARLTDETGIQWLQVQALMRLAACCLAQNLSVQAKKALQQARALNIKGDHGSTLQIELQTYTSLQTLMREVVEQDEQLDVKRLSVVRLHISALGEPTVLIDAMPVTRWRMARAMELFFFLLESHVPLRKDQIIDALWSEPDDIERVNQTFRSTVYYLRQVMGEACLVQQSNLYRLDLDTVYGQFWYDVTAFEEQQLIAETALEEKDDESAAQAFQSMVDFYQGDYVQPFYSNWCVSRRDALRTAFMEAHRQLALIAWRHEIWDKSLLHWQHLLTLDPCLETAHYGIMRCYQQQGKRDQALRQYLRCSKELHEQLNTEPGPALQKLYQRLLNTQT